MKLLTVVLIFRAGFKGIEICLTQFTGIELLHMRKLITLLG